MANQITPNPSVPSQIVQEVKFPQFVNNLGIIPTSYKDSMSYYETLAWLCKYLEETVIPSVNQNGNAVQELQGLYIELNNYVTHYFDNLDVQEEINNKLDQMAESGALQVLVDNIFQELHNEISIVASGSPAGVYSTLSALQTADPNHSRIYVVSADGYWYYYNDSSSQWTRGGIYQASVNTADITQLRSEVDILNEISRPDDFNNSTVNFGKYDTSGTWATSTAQISMIEPHYIKNDIKVTYAEGYRGQCYTWVSDDVTDGCTVSSWMTGENIIEGGKWVSFSLSLTVGSTETLSVDTFWENLVEDSYNIDEQVNKNTTDVNRNTDDINGYKHFLETGNLIRSTNGNEAPFAQGMASGFIKIKTGDVIAAKSATNGSGYAIIAIYNTSKGFSSAPLYGGSGITDYVEGSYTALADGYVRFSCNINAYNNSYFTINGFSIKERLTALETKTENLDESINNIYKIFETVGVIGDSYSSVRTYYTDYLGAIQSVGDIEANSWGAAMARNSNRTYKNFAKGGLECSSWLTDTDKGYPVASQSENLCQAYIIGLGINDSARHNLSYIGTTADINDANEDLNANSFIGNYAKIIQKMKKLQRGVKIFVMTMGNYTSENNQNTYIAYNEAIRDIATYFENVYLIDLFALYHDEYAKTGGFFEAETLNGHFTPLAYQKVAIMISNEISKIIYENPEDFDYITFIGTEYAPLIWNTVV